MTIKHETGGGMKTIIYSNQFDSACNAKAEELVQSKENLLGYLAEKPAHGYNPIEWTYSLLESVGMTYDEASPCCKELANHKEDADTRRKYWDTFQHAAGSPSKKDAAVQYLSELLRSDKKFIEAYYENAKAHAEQTLAEMGLPFYTRNLPGSPQEDDTYLQYSPNADQKESKGWMSRSDMGIRAYIHDDRNRALGQFWPRKIKDVEIYRKDSEPFLTVTFHPLYQKKQQTEYLIPSAWAREAYASRKLHRPLSDNIGNTDVSDFLYQARAIPELEKDPETFGFSEAIAWNLHRFRSHYPDGGFMDYEEVKNIRWLSCAVAAFKKKEFEEYIDSPEVSEWSARRLLASSNPYEVADGIRAIVSTYFYEEDKTGFDQTLAKGIEQFLKTATFEEMRKAFKWFIKGNKKAIQNLKSFGETPAR